MKIALVTDAWQPQVNGVVTTLVELVREIESIGHQIDVIHPGLFKTRPCPGYAGINLAVRPGRTLHQMLNALAPDAIHIATEGPLGWAARAYCIQKELSFTTAFHTKFPEILNAALKVSHALARPVSLFVGRLSHEKNIEAFLRLDTPGTKVVCGVGPLEASLKERYPQVRWLGNLPRKQLAQVYAAADLFVLPSKSETFGLVMLEAMACGTPVAAYPVDGPMEVLGQSGGAAKGGVLHEDLLIAWHRALAVPRHEALCDLRRACSKLLSHDCH